MPLKKGSSKEVIQANVKTELAHQKPLAQALAIAYNKARQSKPKGSK